MFSVFYHEPCDQRSVLFQCARSSRPTGRAVRNACARLKNQTCDVKFRFWCRRKHDFRLKMQHRYHFSTDAVQAAVLCGSINAVYGDNPSPLEINTRRYPPGENLVNCVHSRFPLLLNTLSGATFALSVSRLHIICLAFNLPIFDEKYTRN